MVVNHEKKYIFVCIAKTASTSIRRRLGYKYDPPPEEYHMFLKDILDKNPDAKDYYKFAFVRNPYDRLYSTYINLKYDGHPWATHLKQKETFKEFIMDFQGSKYSEYIHLQPQVDYITCEGKVNLDFLGRFENLDEDFKKVEKHLGMTHKDLEKIRRSSIMPWNPKYYDEEMKKIVRKIYKEDFERFDYEK
jgi:hypothetical protein